MKRTLLSFLAFLLVSTSLEIKAVAYNSDPQQFISEIIDEAKVILSSGHSQEIKAEKLSEIALKTVDIKGLASYTIGKKRKELSPEELEKYGADIVFLKNEADALHASALSTTGEGRTEKSSIEQMINVYMKSTILRDADFHNSRQYSGCAISYLDGYSYTKQFPLAISPDFGYYGRGFISTPDRVYLNEDINVAISELKDSLELQKLCSNYFDDGNRQVPICD